MKITKPKFAPGDDVAVDNDVTIIYAKVERCIYYKSTNSWSYIVGGMGGFEEDRLYSLVLEFGTNKATLVK